MKRRNTAKAFEKFSKRNTHKRRNKDAAKRELMRAVMETSVGMSSLHIADSYDGGRRERSSMKCRRDEVVCEGVFSSSKSGFGFVSCEEREDDVFIPEGKTLGAIDGDVVEVIYHTYHDRFGAEKTEGRVRKIVRPGRKTVLGTYDEERYYYRSKGKPVVHPVLIPDDPHLSMRFRIRETNGAAVGDKVEAVIIRSADVLAHECDVIRNLGRADSKEANYEAILAECEIETEFSPEALAEAEFFASLPLSDEGRVRRNEIIFTMDGEGAKDLDDAVSLRRIRGGWQLGVHIADVSSYVKERTHLDRAVMSRGTSVYFTDKVVPMLPQSLSNGACSLNAGEEKYTLSAIINLSEIGEIKGVKIEPSIIKSRVRGVYSEVNKILDGGADEATRVKYKEVIPTLEKMHELYRLLAKGAVERGALELDSSEAQILLDEKGQPREIVRRERGDAERMIEAFMLTANEAVARYLAKWEIPCVYRVHENPPEDKKEDFVIYAQNLGLDIRGIRREGAGAAEYARLLAEAEEKGISTQVSYTMLRSMAKARYSEARGAHFGLSLEYYCHFTSPIRRLADLATHRIIHKVLIEGKRAELYEKYARRAAAAATEAELRAVTAERRIENLYKVIFMGDRVGDEFDAVINSVTSFGFFCELENTCEGLVPIGELRGVFTFEERTLSLRSRDITYRIGDTVRVRLEEADIIRGKLRFSVVN